MTQRSIDEAHGFSLREQAIADRLEAGASRAAVAEEFGVAGAYITKFAQMYIFTEHRLDTFARRTRACDSRYRAALAASGGTYR